MSCLECDSETLSYWRPSEDYDQIEFCRCTSHQVKCNRCQSCMLMPQFRTVDGGFLLDHRNIIYFGLNCWTCNRRLHLWLESLGIPGLTSVGGNLLELPVNWERDGF